MSEEYVTVNIPKKLHEEVRKRVEKSRGEFKNVEEYVTLVLSEVVKEEEGEQEQAYTPEEEEKIKRRLRKLGYL